MEQIFKVFYDDKMTIEEKDESNLRCHERNGRLLIVVSLSSNPRREGEYANHRDWLFTENENLNHARPMFHLSLGRENKIVKFMNMEVEKSEKLKWESMFKEIEK